MGKDEKYKFPMDNFEIAKILGVSDVTIRRKKSTHAKEFVEGEDYELGYKKGSPPFIKWTKEGTIKLAERLTTVKAGTFLEEMGVKKMHRPYVESELVDIITEAIEGFAYYRKRYPVGCYQIDLYLPKLKVAIECDERGHSNYLEWEDKFREKTIKRELGCKFIRFNPDDPNFNIGKVINEIFSLIIEKESKNRQIEE